MKKFSLCLLLLVLILLPGCGTPKAKSENEIKQEIEEHYLWRDLNVNTTSFSIEKRQTNPDLKEDIVYITMTGENEGFTTEQFYIATYHLYNEGWILDSLEKNLDSTHFSTVTPIKGVDIDEVQEFLESFRSLDFGSFNALRADRDSTPIETQQNLSENYGLDVYTIECRYYYDLFTEVVQFPIVFNFEYLNSDVSYGWIGSVDVENAVRNLKLNEGILGRWEDSDWPSPFYANVVFSNLNEDSCWCEFSSFTYNGSTYIKDTKDYSGWISLDYSFDRDTGCIRKAELVFDSDDGAFECVSGKYLMMRARSVNTGGYVTSHRNLEFYKSDDNTIPGDESNAEPSVEPNVEPNAEEMSSAQIQANLSNWGYATADKETIYYTDWNSGIYKLVKDTKKILTEGEYTDIGLVGSTLFCVEHEDGADKVVSIDTDDGTCSSQQILDT